LGHLVAEDETNLPATKTAIYWSGGGQYWPAAV